MNNNNTHTPTPWILLEKANQRISQLCGTVNTLSNKLGLGDKVRAEDFIVRATLSDSEKRSEAPVNSYEAMREALELAKATIERLTVKHGPFSSTQGTLDVIDQALNLEVKAVRK